MSWRIYSKTYSGSTPEPLPEIQVSEDQHMVSIFRGWGTKQHSPQAINALQEYWHLARQDSEVTSPFPRLPQFSKNANNLRLSVKICGDQLYRTANNDEYKEGLELLLFSLENSELAFTQVGQLNLFVIEGQKIIPLALSQQSISPDQQTLPLRLVGLDRNFEPDIKTTFLNHQKKFLVIAGNSLDLTRLLGHTFDTSSNEQLVDDVQMEMAKAHESTSFWVASFELES